MIRTLVLHICLLAATHTVVAQSKSAPPTAEEQKMLVEARAMMKASGMPVMTAEQELEFLERSRQVRMGILANMQGLRQGMPGLQLPQAPEQAPAGSIWLRQQSDPLVIADCFQMAPAGLGGLADLHVVA